MSNSTPTLISQQQLRDESDLHRLKLALENDKILFVDTKPLFKKYKNDVHILKKSIDELRKVVIRRGGSIGRVGKSILVLSPLKNIKFEI